MRTFERQHSGNEDRLLPPRLAMGIVALALNDVWKRRFTYRTTRAAELLGAASICGSGRRARAYTLICVFAERELSTCGKRYV